MLLTTFPHVRRTRIAVLSLGTYVMMLNSTAFAAPPAVAAPYIPPASEAEEPEPLGYRAAPLPPPKSSLRDLKARVVPAGAPQAQTNVFFLNYDGVTLKHTGDDDAKKNETAFEQFEATYEPYGDGNKRAASFQAVKADWVKYDVVITDSRPEAGEYTMSVNSPTNTIGPGVLGVAMLDCNDDHAASNIVLAFHSAKDKFSASTQATTISQEIAHAYGLEHVNEPADIMNPYNAGGDPSFRDECLKLDPNAKLLCDAQHEMFCEQGKQNSHAEMMWLFGGSEPDAVSPTVNIVAPMDGAQFEAPAEIDIVVEASDNVAVTRVDLFVNGADQHAPRETPPYEWKGAKFPEGMYCLTAEAVDAEPNKATSGQVCFTVAKAGEGPGGETSGGEGESSGGEQPGGGESSGGESGGDETGGDEPGGEAPGTGTSGGPAPDEPESTGSSSSEGDDSAGVVPQNPQYPQPPSFGMNEEDGCGCAQGPRTGGAGLLLLVALASLGRRRRRV